MLFYELWIFNVQAIREVYEISKPTVSSYWVFISFGAIIFGSFISFALSYAL